MLELALRDLGHCIESVETSVQDCRTESERKKWEREDRKARAIIGLPILDENLEQV